MIIVPVKEGENIERALKKFKRKFEKTGAIRELRARISLRIEYSEEDLRLTSRKNDEKGDDFYF